TLMLVLFSMLKNDPKFFQSESVKALRLEAFETLMGTEVRERVRIGRPSETARQEALRLAARELPECQDLVLECADRLVASSAYPLDPMSRVIDQHFPMAAGDDAESREKFLRPLASRVIQRISP
ncbi:MAG: hypothetical protein KIT36_15750, partial [Alphaproteobacteria bacterium]|nr:hypothetical protein [Alphaproteobacteria bacterium]